MIVGRWGRRLTGHSLVLVVVALPALAAGASLAAEVAPGEWERLEWASLAPGSDSFADMFVWSCSPPIDAPGSVATADIPRWVEQARIAQVLGVLACSMTGYLTGMLANGRAFALLATLLFAALPPVAGYGHVLRPDTAVAMLTMLSLLLAQLMAMSQSPAAARLRRASAWLLAPVAASCLAVAVASMPDMGSALLFPNGLAILAAILTGQRLYRALRRRSVAAWPARAAGSRLWPFVFFAMASTVGAALLLALEGGKGAPSGIVMNGSLLPASPWLAAPVVALAVLGAVRAAVRTGRRIGSRGRVTADAVLLAYAAATLMHRAVRGEWSDGLLVAFPFAWLLAEGAILAFLLVAARLRR